MADSGVKFVFSGNEQDAMRAIAALERKYETLRNNIDQVSKRSRKGADEAAAATAQWNNSMANVRSTAAGLIGLLGSIAAASKETADQAERHAKAEDRIARALQIQTGKGDAAAKMDTRKVQIAALRTGSTLDQAGIVAKELAGADFADPAGKSTEVFLQGMKSMNMKGDPTELLRAATEYMDAQGMDKNAANLEGLMQRMQSLFSKSALQLSDMTQLAGKSQIMRGKLTSDEQLATFSVMKDKMGADVASTSMQTITTRLATAGTDKQASEALASMGIKPGEVDLIGEDINQVLARLDEGFKKLAPEARTAAAKDIAGREAMGALMGLIEDRRKIPERMALMKDRRGYDEAVRVGTSGEEAADNRKLVMEGITLGDKGKQVAKDNRMLDILDAEKRAAGSWDVTVKAERMINEMRYATGDSIDKIVPKNPLSDPYGINRRTRAKFEAIEGGGGLDAMINETFGGAPGRKASDDGLDKAGASTGGMSAVEKLLERNNALMEAQNKLLEKGAPRHNRRAALENTA